MANVPAVTQNLGSASAPDRHASAELPNGQHGCVDDPQAHRREEQSQFRRVALRCLTVQDVTDIIFCASRRLGALERLYERVPPLRSADLGVPSTDMEAQSWNDVAKGRTYTSLIGRIGSDVPFSVDTNPKCNDAPGGLGSVGRVRPDDRFAGARHPTCVASWIPTLCAPLRLQSQSTG